MRESLSGSIVNLGITRKLQFRANYLKIRVRFQKIDCDRGQVPADVPKRYAGGALWDPAIALCVRIGNQAVWNEGLAGVPG